MIESVLEFGPGRRLVGILTRPPQHAEVHDLAVLITNSGIIHRVGANRVHVRLARFLAARGYPCLRYDLPGIGDSERSGTGASVQVENLGASMAAMDALQRSGIARRFVLIGLCSGADHSFMVGCVDSRVAGAVLIDPTGVFSTRRHQLNIMLRTVRRGMRPRVWIRLVTGKYQLSRSISQNTFNASDPGAPRSLTRSGNEDVRAQIRDGLEAFVKRGSRLYIVITGHNAGVYTYDRQMLDAFPDVAGLDQIIRVDRRLNAEHTFTAEIDRSFLESGITDWLKLVRNGIQTSSEPVLR